MEELEKIRKNCREAYEKFVKEADKLIEKYNEEIKRFFLV
jgi:vacuolar-type H+-ATPase subunit E/Vma4